MEFLHVFAQISDVTKAGKQRKKNGRNKGARIPDLANNVGDMVSAACLRMADVNLHSLPAGLNYYWASHVSDVSCV